MEGKKSNISPIFSMVPSFGWEGERERERRIRKEGVIILLPSAPFPNGREYTREMMMIRRRGPKERK